MPYLWWKPTGAKMLSLEGFHLHIYCHVCICWACLWGKMEGWGQEQLFLETRSSVLWWEWRLIWWMPAINAGNTEFKNPWGQIWPSPKWGTCSWPIDFKKTHTLRAFLNVFTIISEGEHKCYWRRMRISSLSLQKEGGYSIIFHPK